MSQQAKTILGITLAVAGLVSGAGLSMAQSPTEARKPPMAAVAPQGMKDFQDNWNVSYMKTMKDFQDNWVVSYLKATKDFQDNWKVSYQKNPQDNWNVSYMKEFGGFQDNWNISYMKALKDFQDQWNVSYITAVIEFQDK